MFDQSYHVMYRIDKADNIVFAGDEWNDAAIFNNAPELTAENVVGQSIWKFVHGNTIRHLYMLILEQARAGKMLRFDGQCNVGDVRRKLDISIRPGEHGEVVIESRMAEAEFPVVPAAEVDSGGYFSDLIVTCSWCRRIRVGTKTWCDVEEAVPRLHLFELDELPAMSHGMCGNCFTEAVAKLQKQRPAILPMGPDPKRSECGKQPRK